MKTKSPLPCVLLWALTVLMVPCGLFAQQAPPVVAEVTFTQEQLDQMLAPIALYPDALLAQILLASTYPDQVIAADHWLRDHQGLKGPALNSALNLMDWDLSVKALAPFPRVMDMMAQQPEWTQKLGEAFLAQQIDVMASIQRLRRSAQKAVNLKKTSEQRIVVRRERVEILSHNPQVVYVPPCNPAVLYGSWWWPSYSPFAYYSA